MLFRSSRGAKRNIPDEVKRRIKRAYENENAYDLISELLELDKFPLEDPYVAFLRKEDKFLDQNKETVNRLANALFSLEYEDIIDNVEEPKVFNRQLGTVFGDYIPNLGYPLMSPGQLKNHRKGIALLEGSDQELRDFAENEIGCELDKNPDILAKVGQQYVIGEAKFLTDYGGHQNTQFADAVNLLKGPDCDAKGIAILDGVVWIRRNTKMHRRVKKLKKPALTALLLEDYLQSLKG